MFGRIEGWDERLVEVMDRDGGGLGMVCGVEKWVGWEGLVSDVHCDAFASFVRLLRYRNGSLTRINRDEVFLIHVARSVPRKAVL